LGHVSRQEWLLIDALDSIAGIRLYDTQRRRVGSTGRDRGEASVFAAAEQGATAITDDPRAAQVGRFHELDVRGTIWLLAGAFSASPRSERRQASGQ